MITTKPTMTDVNNLMLTIDVLSFSFEGEDRIANSLLRDIIKTHDKKDLFYIDIGSNHPQNNNNTMLFAQKGYRGICVEPLKHYNEMYKKMRPNDVIENCGISNRCGWAELQVYEDDSASSMHADTVMRYGQKFAVVDKIRIECMTYSKLIEKHNLGDKNIPFVDLDIEGEDTVVLEEITSSKSKPLLICVENKLVNLERSYPDTKIDEIAKAGGYTLISKTALNSFYILSKHEGFSWIPQEMKTV